MIQLLADKVVAMGFAESISLRDGAPDTQKNELRPWNEEGVVHPGGERLEFVARMEDVLDLYHADYDPDVCIPKRSGLRDKVSTRHEVP